MTDGTCVICKEQITDRRAPGHFKKCFLGKASGGKRKKFILRVTSGPSTPYWMYVRMDAAATLNDLDGFLRDSWLECCGHLSEFTIGDAAYQYPAADMPSESKSMRVQAKKVLSRGLKFMHEHDFGTTSTLELTVREEYLDDAPQKKPVELLARNNDPEHSCSMCGAEAKLAANPGLFPDECLFFCRRCSKKSEEFDPEAMLPIANSPRTGMCAYGC